MSVRRSWQRVSPRPLSRPAQLFQDNGLISNQGQFLGSAPAFELAFTLKCQRDRERPSKLDQVAHLDCRGSILRPLVHRVQRDVFLGRQRFRRRLRHPSKRGCRRKHSHLQAKAALPSGAVTDHIVGTQFLRLRFAGPPA